MQKLLTIVVPVYKVEPYINKCLDSCILEDEKLMSQLEVIIVNDGTPDNSAEMSREYVKRYPKTFRQIDKENGGHGSAWNVGLKEATGKYLRFLDSDDWLTNLDKLMAKLQETDADIIISNYKKFYAITDRYEDVNITNDNKTAQSITRDLLLTLPHGFIDINFWSSTYRTDILKPLYPLFAEHVMYDDSVLTFAPLIHGRSIEFYNIYIYNYLLGREGQTMSPKVQIKNAHSYVVCLQRQEQVRATLDVTKVPADLLQCIDDVIYNYAHLSFGYFAYLPYCEAKQQMQRVVQIYPLKANSRCSKVWRRYHKYPFCIFYAIEQLRTIWLQLKN